MDDQTERRRAAEAFWASHRATWEASGGTEMAEVLGMKVIQLNTVGRVTGAPRWVLLTTLPADGGGWLVAASNLGAEQDPDWWQNLRAAGGQGTVTVDGETVPVTAEELTGDERAAAYERFVETYPDYASYREQTSRQIPVVHLKP